MKAWRGHVPHLHGRRATAILSVALLALFVPILSAAAESPDPARQATLIDRAFEPEAGLAALRAEPGSNAAQGQVSPDDFWVPTNGPQGGDAIALATNASGHVFVGT